MGGGGGGGSATLGHKQGVVGFGPNTRNRAVAARF